MKIKLKKPSELNIIIWCVSNICLHIALKADFSCLSFQNSADLNNLVFICFSGLLPEKAIEQRIFHECEQNSDQKSSLGDNLRNHLTIT